MRGEYRGLSVIWIPLMDEWVKAEKHGELARALTAMGASFSIARRPKVIREC